LGKEMPHYEIVDRVWRGEARWHLEEPESADGAKSFTWAFTVKNRINNK
jgi:hypothetical protein